MPSLWLENVPLEPGDHTTEEHALLSERIVAYRPAGPLFFAAANRFLTDVEDVEVLILRMSQITTMDATGASLLGEAITHLERRGIAVLISQITDEHHELFATLGVAQNLRGRGRVFADTPSAIAYARELIETRAPRALQAA